MYYVGFDGYLQLKVIKPESVSYVKNIKREKKMNIDFF